MREFLRHSQLYPDDCEIWPIVNLVDVDLYFRHLFQRREICIHRIAPEWILYIVVQTEIQHVLQACAETLCQVKTSFFVMKQMVDSKFSTL
jgi:hypothetical protein